MDKEFSLKKRFTDFIFPLLTSPPDQAVCIDCPTQEPVLACVSICAGQEENRIRPCTTRIHKCQHIPSVQTTHITHTQQAVEGNCFVPAKKDKNPCSLLCVPLCTLTQSLRRGLGNTSPAHTHIYNSSKHKHSQSRLKNTSGSVSTTLSKAKSHCLRLF